MLRKLVAPVQPLEKLVWSPVRLSLVHCSFKEKMKENHVKFNSSI